MARELKLMKVDEVAAALATLAGWQVLGEKLHREFRFANFPDAMAFMNQVAEWAETWDHHPEWSNVYNRVSVDLTTHDVGGISFLDVQLAAKMNELAAVV